MAFNFPDVPAIGEVFTANGRTWQWDGVAWRGSTVTTIDADTLDGKAGSEYLLVADAGNISGGITTEESIAYSIALG